MAQSPLHSSSGKSAEKDDKGQEFLSNKTWTRMGTATTMQSRASEMIDSIVRKLSNDLEGDELLKVCWLSGTLFFIVGGYWLLRSLKDPIISVINGVRLLLSYYRLVSNSRILYLLCTLLIG